MTPYQVDPALEYRTFAHPSDQRLNFARPSVRHDGRVLAVGTDQGAVIWDLSRGTELAFLPIGNAWHLTFEPSGDLLTSGSIGVQRWPIQLDPGLGEFRIGPPRRISAFPASLCGIDEDRSGRIVALANHNFAYIASPERTIRVGPLDDCRGVSISPDGKWLATGNHTRGAKVWSIADATPVADLPIDGSAGGRFSPDGKWLLAGGRLWEVGTWREARRIGNVACFSPDGRSVVVLDPSRVIRLVEIATDRTLARLESPDLCSGWPAFSPDGSRLVVSTNDGPAVHVWDLQAIRKRLAGMRLDWDAPAYSGDDPAAPSAPPLPALKVDYGPLAGHLEHLSGNAESLLRRYTARLEGDPHDADAYHHRAHALLNLQRIPEAIKDLTRAIELRPNDAHYRSLRGAIYLDLKQYEPAIADLEAALALSADQPMTRERLSQCCNNRAWELANGPGPRRGLDRAVALARRAVDLAPGEGGYLNTMGVVLYRAGRYDDAIATLKRSGAAHRGQFDGFDLFFLAMAHHGLGHRDRARDCFDRAVHWVQEQKNLDARNAQELAGFRAEAQAILAGPAGELPEDVFAEPR